MFTRIREYWQDYKAWRRGEYRVGAYGSRGRVYAKKDPLQGSRVINTKTTYTVLAKVMRVDGRSDEHYNLTEDMKLSPDEFDTLRGGKPNG